MLVKNRSEIPIGWNYHQWGTCSRTLRVLKIIFIGGILTSIVFLSTWYFPDSAHVSWKYFWNSSVTEGDDRLVISSVEISNQSKPIILLWTQYFSNINWLPSLKSLDCPVECIITRDRKLLDPSAAVIFHLRNVDVDDLPPWSKNSMQKWVLFNKESPPHSPVKIIKALEGKIHWTATYRQDSTFHAPYGMVVKRKSKPTKEFQPPSSSKQYLVCWIVSHCTTPSQRETYVKVLSQYVPVTVYGSCGTEVCPNGSAKDCYQNISTSCKFYMSFENSICKEYVTEKLFYALDTEMVPIVMSGANYSQILPEHSYIDALKFLNPKDLATYLLRLDDNINEFQEYHRWKMEYEVVDMSYKWACDLCQRLYENTFTDVDVYKDMSSWWIDSANCIPWTDLFLESDKR